MSYRIDLSDAVLVFASGIVVLLLNRIRRSLIFAARARGHPLPPGPRPLPIIGNLLDVPQKSPWLRYHEWSKTYGAYSTISALSKVYSTRPFRERSDPPPTAQPVPHRHQRLQDPR